MMQTTEQGMFSPQLHPPSKTKIPILVDSRAHCNLEIPRWRREEEKGRKIKVLLFKQHEMQKISQLQKPLIRKWKQQQGKKNLCN